MVGKSFFTDGDDYGLAIGNLTNQMFANFYLHEFDNLMNAGSRVTEGKWTTSMSSAATNEKSFPLLPA